MALELSHQLLVVEVPHCNVAITAAAETSLREVGGGGGGGIGRREGGGGGGGGRDREEGGREGEMSIGRREEG